jgi:hypothetical protein
LVYWEKFLEFEQKNALFQMEEDGIYVWDILRHHVYVEYQWDNYKDQPQLKDPPLRMFILLLRRMGYLILFLFRKSRPNLFYIHSRDRRPDGRFVDRNTHDFLQRMSKESFILETFEGKGVTYSYPVSLINPASLFNRIYGLFYKKKDYSQLVDKINTDLGLQWSNDIVNRHLRYFRSERLFFRWIFRLKKIKRLYVAFNNQKSHYSAARECGIQTIEFQHGIIDRGHVDYNYPPDIDAGSRVYCPDVLLTYSHFWNREVNYPVKQVLAVGNTIAAQIGSARRPVHAGLRTIGFISADVFGVRLAEVAIAYAELNPGGQILFKLHPNQFSRRKEYIERFRQFPGIQVITNEQATSAMILGCDAVVLIQSTIAYEALQAGVPVFIYKRMTYYRHAHIFDRPNVFLFDDASEIVLRDRVAAATEEIFFEEFDETVYLLLANTH